MMLFHKLKFFLIIFIVFQSLRLTADTGTHLLLEQYVKLDDGAFSYQQISSISKPGLTAYIYKLTSQNWRMPSEVNRTLWDHRLTVVVPDNLTNDKAILFIFGGENTADFLTPDPKHLELLATFANLSGSIAIQINQVPNQPLVFADEPGTARSEDDLIAYSFDTAMGSNDYTWAGYLPMTKSVIKTMDAVQSISGELNLSYRPREFVLAGFSKRGAITWLSAAVDKRVIAISPGVYDSINFAPSIENQRITYGKFPDPLKEYNRRNVLDRFRIHEGRQLTDVVDPYTYRDTLSIPKYIINATGDQFYPPDSSRFYFNQLKGETLLRYLPNTDHGGSDGGFESAMLGLLAWYQKIVNGIPRPAIHWNLAQTNLLSVTVSDPTATALLWSAENVNAKDFRLETFGPNWQATPLPIPPDGKMDIALQMPTTGWKGYFVELTFQGISGISEKYTTPVFVLPDTDPFELTQPIFTPKPKSAWRAQLADIIAGATENAALADSFPIRSIGNETVTSIDAAYALLAVNHGDNKLQAQQECLATRLNIKDGQFDWYSKPYKSTSLVIWKLWNYANLFYHARIYSAASFICAHMNS